MRTYHFVHEPEPPEPASISRKDGETSAAFLFGDAKVWVDDPAWFDAVATWATQEALRLRAAQAGVQPCQQCGHGGQLAVDLAGRRLCAKCYGQVVGGGSRADRPMLPKDAA